MTSIAELGMQIDSAQAEKAADNLDALTQAGTRAELAAGKVSTAWDAAGKKLSKSADGATASIEEQREELSKLIGQIDPTVAALDRLDAQQKKLKGFKSAGLIDAETFERFNSRLEQTRTGLSAFDDNLNRTGNTAKQTAAALRGVPAQFTDIAVSLQAGQAPLTVFLQQGGQLKDMFGGAGPAARALGGYVLGLVNPFTVAAAAVGVLGLAYYKGSEEADAYRLALVETGNAAGITTAQMAQMAKNVSATVGTTGQAAEVLAKLASTGNIAGDSFERIAVTALAYSKATGSSVDQVVNNFSKLAKDPAKASKDLTEQLGYLSAATFQQIQALEQQGDKQGAANLAEQAYNEALKGRTAEIQDNLGFVESAWKSAGNAAKGAWDAFLDIGREDTFEEKFSKLQDKLSRVRLASQAPLSIGDNPDLSLFASGEAGVNSEFESLLQDEQNKTERAWQQRMRAENSKQSAADLTALQNDYNQSLSKEETLKIKLNELDQRRGRLLAQEGIDRAAVEKQYSSVRQKLIDDAAVKPKKVAAPALDTTSINAVQNQLKLVVGEYDAAEKRIEALSRAGLISQADAYQQRVTLLDQEKAKVQEAYGAQIAAIEQLQGRSNLSAQQRISLENQVADARAAQTKALTDLDAKREQLTINEQGRQAKLQQATDSYNRSLDAQVELLRLQGERAAAAVGMGREQAALYNELNRANDEYVKGLRDLDKLLAEGSINQEQYNQRLSALQRQQTQLQEQVIDNYRLMQVAQSDWSNGANAAWQDYLSNARDVAGQTRDAFTDALTGMEDYLLSFITGTKASFKDLVRSIIADFARIQLKQIIGGITGGGSGSTSGGILSGIGSLFGGSSGGSSGSISGLGDIVSVGKNLYSAYSTITGVGQAVLAGYQTGGLTGALSGGAGYYGGLISNAASTIGGYFGFGGGAAAGTGAAAGAGAGAGAGASGLLSSLGSTVAAAWPLAVIAGMYASGKLYDAGVRPDGKTTLETGGNTAFGKATMLPGAITSQMFEWQDKLIAPLVGGKLAAILSGSTLSQFVWDKVGTKLFGGQWQTKDAGISLGVTGGELDASTYENQKKKGGLFSSSKKRTRYGALDDDTQSYLDGMFATGLTGIEDLYKQFGISLTESAVDGLTVAATQLSSMGKTQEELQTAINGWFTSTFDSITDQLNTATGSQFKAGLTFEGLTTLLNNLLSVNSTLDLLNVTALKVTPSGAYAAEALQALAGGMDQLGANVNAYYEAFFTEAEKQEDSLAAITKQFSALGITLPGVREGYRDIVEALDVTTAAGQAMFTSLTKLASTADSYYDILESQSEAAKQALAEAQSSMLSVALGTLQRAVKKQQDAIQEAYNARTEALNASLSSSQSAVSSLTSMTNSLSSALKTMLGQSDQATRVLYGQATATLETAAAIARAGGSLANFQGLDDALSTVTGNNSSGYGDWLSFARDQGRSAALIGELSATAGDQLSSAEKTVAGIQTQIELAKKQFDLESKMLQGQLDLAQAQIDAINGVDNTLLSMVEALNQFAAAVLTASPNGTGGKNADTLIEAAYQAVLGRSADKAGAAYWKEKLVSGQLSSNDLRGAIGQAGAANGESINTAYQNILGRAPDAAGLAYWQQQVAAGNISDINAAIRAAAIANGQIPAFAAGGDHFGGFRVVGEFGREIEATGPAKYYSASKTAEMLNGGGNSAALLTEMRAVRAELTEMKYSNSAIAKHTRKTADGIQQQNEVGVATLETA